MDFCILAGSPREKGNTMALLGPVIQELEARGASWGLIRLHEKSIKPCTACRACQNCWQGFGCPQEDDMGEVFDAVLACGTPVLATPIYSWYCTPPMKAALDRLVYGMNKYYGDEKGPSLWQGKRLALVSSCGYRPEKGADLWEAGMTRYCKHSGLQYLGMLAERDLGYGSAFMDEGKASRARDFAREVLLVRENIAEISLL